MPIPRTARRRSRASQTASPNAASVRIGSTHASVFRSWKASCAVSSSSDAEDHDPARVGGDPVGDLVADPDPVGGLDG